MLLTNAILSNGDSVAVRTDGDRIVEVGSTVVAVENEQVVDLEQRILLPAFAEPHAHLDKALTADRVPNPAGDLLGAIVAWSAHRVTLSADDIIARATRAVKILAANGTTAIRTHVDVTSDVGLSGLEALMQVKDAVEPFMTIQIVGLIGRPVTGPAGADHRALLRDALAAGLDIVGGAPHIDNDSVAASRFLMELAGEAGTPLDLHTDENLDLSSLDLEVLANDVISSGFTESVTAGHCVSLGIQPENVQERVAARVAESGISVVVLPQTNLFLQSRGQGVAPVRGLTALAALEAAEARVAGGADNLQDPFCTVGRGDALETAALLVMAGHLTAELAFDYVSNRSRAVLGLEPVSVAAGSKADLVAIRAGSIREAVAMAPGDRVVVKNGLVVHGAGV